MTLPRQIIYRGVNFTTVRFFLFNMYFYQDDMPQEAIDAAMAFIVPMQHNITNPLQAKEGDTFIEYWISRDERLTQDHMERSSADSKENTVYKVASIDIRFVGVEAETWAKAFHHITKRENVQAIAEEVCQGRLLEHIGDVVPVNIDYYSVGNSSIAFDLSIKIEYKETVEITWKPLQYIGLAPGTVLTGGQSEE